jgi:hypothetical protein
MALFSDFTVELWPTSRPSEQTAVNFGSLDRLVPFSNNSGATPHISLAAPTEILRMNLDPPPMP